MMRISYTTMHRWNAKLIWWSSLNNSKIFHSYCWKRMRKFVSQVLKSTVKPIFDERLLATATELLSYSAVLILIFLSYSLWWFFFHSSRQMVERSYNSIRKRKCNRKGKSCSFPGCKCSQRSPRKTDSVARVLSTEECSWRSVGKSLNFELIQTKSNHFTNSCTNDRLYFSAALHLTYRKSLQNCRALETNKGIPFQFSQISVEISCFWITDKVF